MYTNHKIVFIDEENKKSRFFCSVCKFPLVCYEDFQCSKSHDVCGDCYLQFVEARKEDWSNGWRPDKEKIKNYISRKKSIIINKK